MDYAEILAAVRELIADTGRDATFERLSSTPADANKPWNGPAAPAVAASVVTKAVFVPASGDGLGMAFIPEELLKRVTEVCLVPPSDSFDIATCTSVTDGGARYGAEWVHRLKPGDTVLLFAVGMKR